MVSITFNGTDLSTFGLELQQIVAPITQEAKFAQLQDKAYLFEAVRPGKVIQLSCIIYADNLTDLLTKIDNINKVIAIKEPKPLILGHQTDRYWMAQFQQMTGPFTGIGAYEIELVFFAADPLAYAVDETIYITTLNTDPWIRTLNVRGTAEASPVYTLTPQSGPFGDQIIFTNITTGQTLIIDKEPVVGDVIVIDTERWIVTNNSIPIMNLIEGQFPRLKPGNNSLNISGLGNSPQLKVEYRGRFI